MAVVYARQQTACARATAHALPGLWTSGHSRRQILPVEYPVCAHIMRLTKNKVHEPA